MTIPETVGVVGGGRMGAGIAHAFLLAGARVTVLERDDAAAQAASAALHRVVVASVERGSTTESVADLTGRATMATDAAELAGTTLVVEAVPVDFELKADVLRRLEGVLADDAFLATNTSSLSIDDLGATLRRPERFVGLHFFNPVPSSSLVEIVRGEQTGAEIVDRALTWVADLGKTPIVVQNSPGFASTRLGAIVALEAIRMLEQGVASAEDIDTAMVLGYKYPVGPLRLTDMVGLDVRLGIAEYLERTLGDRFAVPDLLREHVAAGRLGRKSGQGFFSWDS